MTNIGIVGCGAIGTEVATAVCEGKTGDANLVALFDQFPSAATTLADKLPDRVVPYPDFESFLKVDGMELVVECASPAAVKEVAPQVLASGLDLLMLSSGALADVDFFRALSALSAEGNRRLLVPSGALGGIDAIRATRHLLEEVTLTSTKRPEALRGAPGYREWEDVKITKPTVVFEGNALEAIQSFPANVNVGVTLSLAGLGPESTKVKVVADPASPGNVHEVHARGEFGMFDFRLENRPHVTNPRTSYLAILSALETLRAACTSGPHIGT